MAQTKLLGRQDVAPFVPDFGKCADHFVLHAGKCLNVEVIGHEFWVGVGGDLPPTGVQAPRVEGEELLVCVCE